MNPDSFPPMNMKHKVVFYLPMSLMRHAFEFNLDLMQVYIDNGHSVTWLYCNGELPVCDVNSLHTWSNCHLCKNQRKAGLKWLDGKPNMQKFYRVTENQLDEVNQIERISFTSIDEVRRFTLNGADIGLAAVGVLVNRFREPYPNINDHIESLKKELRSAAIVYFSIRNFLSEAKPDEFILWNGRSAVQRPALRAAQQLGINCYVLEAGDDLSEYYMAKGTYPHDVQDMKGRIEQTFGQSILTFEEKLKVAKDWFDARDRGIAVGGFTESQERGLLPANLSIDKTNLVIFNSSEDEFVCIEEWNNPHYLDQNDGISSIMESISESKNIRVFLRVHPNLSGIVNSQTKGIEAIQRKYPELNVIPAESKISTYALLKSCDVALTFGSTVGIEAVYNGKPSILMGRAIYENLGGCIRPASHAELIEILQAIANGQYPIQQMPNDVAVAKYGFFMKKLGIPATYRRFHGQFSHSFVKDNKEFFIKQPMATRALFYLYPKIKKVLAKARLLSRI